MAPDAQLQLAATLGANALPLFAVLLAVLLAAVAISWWLMRVYVLPQMRNRLPQPALVIVNGLIGGIIIISAAMGFAEIAEALEPDGTLSRFDEAVTASISQNVGTATLQVFALFTRLGDTLTLSLLGVAVALALWIARRRALAAGWVLAVGGNALLNPTLKRVFERVRPLHDHGIVNELGWSFPSGHTSGATVAYGMLAYIALNILPPRWQLPALLTATALAFTVGCSRVFLQVHFVSDVAAGFASGAAWLTVCIVSVELSRRYRVRARR